MKTKFALAVAVLSLCLPAILGTASAADKLAPAEGPVLLTVAGKIVLTNREALDPFQDALFKFQEAEFDGAAEFDRTMLEGLGMQTIETQAAGWPGRHRFEGPALTAVLEAVGATGATVTVIAIDGYAASLPIADIRRFQPILALKRDGKYLALGGRGPSWLVFPRERFPELQAKKDDADWVWGIVRLAVE